MCKHIRWQRHSWKRSTVGLSAHQRCWLTLQGSLTQALRAMGSFSLQVLCEHRERVWEDEADALSLRPGCFAWVREVVMSVDGIPCVAARSLTTLEASRGRWRGLRHCGIRPLGEQLYHRADIRRTPFEWHGWMLPVHLMADDEACSATIATPSTSSTVVGRARIQTLLNNIATTGNVICHSGDQERLFARRSLFMKGGITRSSVSNNSNSFHNVNCFNNVNNFHKVYNFHKIYNNAACAKRTSKKGATRKGCSGINRESPLQRFYQESTICHDGMVTGGVTHGAPMIVMECFLPAFWAFAQSYRPINLNPRWSPCRRSRV